MRAQFVILVLASILILGLIPFNGASAVTEDTKLTASDAAANDLFGFSVSISGDTAIVGARGDDDAVSSSGSAYVFVRSGATWTQQAKLTASDAAAGDRFGFSVSISGNTAIVGSIFDDDVPTSSGSAYVFVRSETTWTQQAKLTASDAAAGDRFGFSVSISGNTAIVGVPFDNDVPTNSGSAYVFDFTPTIPAQIDQIIALGLPDSVTQSLIGPLEQAQNLLEDGMPQNDVSVCGKLTAFLNEVNAKEGNGQLTMSEATSLRSSGLAIFASLGC